MEAGFGKCTGKKKNLDRIVSYCQKDVITVVQVFLRMNGETLVRAENIEIKGKTLQ